MGEKLQQAVRTVRETAGESVTAAGKKRSIRLYRPEDRQAVRAICAATGLLGESISSILPEDGFFVDFLTGYYTDVEPGTALVVEAEGRVVGYLLGCTSQERYRRYQRCLLGKAVFTVLKGLLKRDYDLPARRFFWWLAWRGWREVPGAPAGGAHFHFNILPHWKDAATTRQLVENFLALLRRRHPEIETLKKFNKNTANFNNILAKT